jgi:hypothetical protein
MRFLRRNLATRNGQLPLALCVLIAAATIGGESLANGDRHVLIVGVSAYPHLSKSLQLEGPVNDAELIERLARETFRVPPENITVLSDAKAAKDPQWQPTRAHIEREFLRLAKVAHPGDYVWIFLAGHGSQQPAVDDRNELDGLDEIFLPCDVEDWDFAQGKVKNSISDNELAEWLRSIEKQNASIWLVVDACHSGTLLRGPGERTRNVTPDQLGVPASLVASSRSRTRGKAGGEEAAFQFDELRRTSAIYACHPNEVTVERVMPRGAADAKSHGLLTYTLAESLATTMQVAGRLPTYRELIRHIGTSYAGMGRSTPLPLAEGGELDREVFGDRSWKNEQQITLTSRNEIDAGRLQGLSAGSILEIKTGKEADDAVVGYIEVTAPSMFTSKVRPVAYKDVPKPDHVPVPSRCRPVFIAAGEMRLRVAIDHCDTDGRPISATDRAALATQVSDLLRELPTVELVEVVDAAAWLLRPGNGGVYLLPANRWSDQEPNSTSLVGPANFERGKPGSLKPLLAQIARAETLCHLAADARFSQVDGRASPKLDIVILRSTGESDTTGGIPIDFENQRETLFNGDRAVIEVTNGGDADVDVNLFYVDSNYGISCLFPRNARFNRLSTGRSISLPVEFVNTRRGIERLIVIGVAGRGERADLNALEQPSWEAVESTNPTRGTAGTAGLESPLGKLLRGALYADAPLVGKTRGLARDDAANYSMRLVTWQVDDQPRSKANTDDVP